MRKSQFNFIRRNIRESPQHFKMLDTETKRYELAEKIKLVKDKKEDIEVQKRKMNIIWLNKWALIREKKEE